MQKLTILLYLLSCSIGLIAQDFWSLPGPDEKNGITSYGLVENYSDLVHGLLEVEGALWWDLHGQKKIAVNFIMIERLSFFSPNKGIPYMITWHPWAFLFDYIERPNELGFSYWARSFRDKRIIYDEEDDLYENDSKFLHNGKVQYQIRDRYSKEQDLFRISQFIQDPANPLFFLFKDHPPGFVFSYQELFTYKEMSNGLLTSQTDPPTSIYKR
ncbi:hypothetical protein M9H77_31116 [Catharanthus roseus]|uniref:Uncharacterized protein n=1 Tax=Catharanthus roseus TaxID=4058 RepID=A0ACC0A005_CATRO|nr:hypothetical protein M9H77_31116 [Catharanthus roseus]